MPRRRNKYPDNAYGPDGVLWWQRQTYPGTKRRFGDEPKIAAWLAFNVGPDGTFTMRDLRAALGAGASAPNDAEQLNRRLRGLRPGWLVLSYKTDASLPMDTYRLKRIGWHPGLGLPRPRRPGISQRMHRRVIDRDHRRCVVCGVGRGESYPGEPDTVATLTVGHRVPQHRDSRVRSEDELQTECGRCNEPVREELRDPVRLAEVMPDLRRLNRAERAELLKWLVAGYRLRSRLDDVHDLVRGLTPDERDAVVIELRAMLGLEREA